MSETGFHSSNAAVGRLRHRPRNHYASASDSCGRPPVSTSAVVEAISLARPIQYYARAWADTGWTCLLESALTGGPRGRWSFAAGPPSSVMRIRRAGNGADIETLNVRTGDESRQTVSRDGVWRALRDVLNTHRATSVRPATEVPFVGGAIGYVGYEAQHFVESLPRITRPGLGLPDVYLLFVDSVLAFDHAGETASLATIAADPGDRAALRAAWLDRIRSIDAMPEGADERSAARAEARGDSTRSSQDATKGAPTHALLNHAAYLDAVRKMKAQIAAGDFYEANLTYQHCIPFSGEPWKLYEHLRVANPAPFAAFLELPEAAVVCCSPERFLRLDAEGWAETRPIKGTRPRGDTKAEDAALRDELAASEKDRAEHAMIVDLLRNDFGRVCRFGTLRVEDLMSIESYRSVHQMVSTVRGQLRPGCDSVDLLRACFPGGSMTGAPKIAAQKCINELELEDRGVYSGCIGYFDVRGGMDLNIVIRTAVVADGIARVGTGGAIVTDSDPTAEWDETLHKSRPLTDAIAHMNQHS